MRVVYQRAWLARMFFRFRWAVLLLGLHTLCGAEMPKVVFVQIDEPTADFFDDPPSPLDYAAFLKNVQKHEPRGVGVVDLLHWPQVAPEILNGLITQAKSLNVVYAAMLDNDAPDPDIAKSLSAFPQDFLAAGDLSALSSFKSVPRLPVEGLLEDSAVGFTIIDFGDDMKVTASGIEVPLIARGPNSELALSLPLLIAGQAHGLAWNTASIDIGTAVQLGDDTEPIPLDLSGKVVVPLEEPESLQRLGGERLIATDVKVEAIRDAVLILGSDLERDRVFLLPDGESVSRAELVARTVCYLLEQAAVAPDSPPTSPVEIPATESVLQAEDQNMGAVDKPASPSTDRHDYHFHGLRASNKWLWVLGISCGLAIGCLLLRSKRKQVRSEPEKELKEKPERAPAKPESSQEPGESGALTKKRKKPRKEQSLVKQEEKRDAEKKDALDDDTQSGDDASPPRDTSQERAATPDDDEKRPARKKQSRTRRRRPS